MKSMRINYYVRKRILFASIRANAPFYTNTHTYTCSLFFPVSLSLCLFLCLSLSISPLAILFFATNVLQSQSQNPNERIHKPSCDVHVPAVLFPVVSCCILLHSTYTLHILVIAYVRMHRKYMQDSPVRSLHRERFAAWVRTQQFPRRDTL